MLAALAAVTEHIGLAGTLNTTFNEPYELARQLATLDHLSGGRAGWNVVTSLGRLHRGELPPRRLPRPTRERYARADEFVAPRGQLWDSWGDDAVVADAATGRFLRAGTPATFAHSGPQFDIGGRFTVPRSPQGHPVILQAGDSADGPRLRGGERRTRSSRRHSHLPRRPGVLRATSRRALARTAGTPTSSRSSRRPRSCSATPRPRPPSGRARSAASRSAGDAPIRSLEQVWNRDLSGYDPDGPLPDVDPDPEARRSSRAAPASTRTASTPSRRVARAGRGEELLSIRELVDRGVVARGVRRHARAGRRRASTSSSRTTAPTAFILGRTSRPAGLDEFVDKVVPLLQERGSLRTEYDGSTLRDNLALPAYAGHAEPAAV